ncbi:MAG: S8 family serine peptidase, partial [Bacteroidota bacterium]
IVNWHRVGEEGNDYLNNDPNGHGTAVAYLTAHRFVNAGKQSQVRLHSYRVLDANGQGTLAQAIIAIQQAINDNVDIINMSFGFDGLDCTNGPQAVFSSYLNLAADNDILMFTSAGNNGNSLATAPQWPAAETDNHYLFTVGAVACDISGYTIWDYSNYGEDYLDLTAPGQSVLVPFTPGGPEQFISASGTSFAAPIAAGVAANYLSRFSRVQTNCLLRYIVQARTALPRAGLPFSTLGPINLHPRLNECVGEYDLDGEEIPEFLFYNQYLIQKPDRPKNLAEVKGTLQAIPNPFAESITVKTNQSEGQATELILYNTNGGIVRRQQTKAASAVIPTDNLPPGVYFLMVRSDASQQTIKITKQ